MIPKIVHLCWLSGDPYPQKIQYCIDTWKKYCPDYEIMLWDTKRFDVNSMPWTKQAFEAKKYAFAADYIRLYAIYNYGGIYLDSDVEVLKSFDDLLHLPYFAGIEARPDGIEMAAFGAEKGTGWVKYMLDYYENRNFVLEGGRLDTVPMPEIMGKRIRNKFYWTLIDTPEEFDSDPSRFCLFSRDWFCAHPRDPEFGLRYYITENTYCIHHFANTWRLDMKSRGPLHRLFFKVTGQASMRHFTLYGEK